MGLKENKSYHILYKTLYTIHSTYMLLKEILLCEFGLHPMPGCEVHQALFTHLNSNYMRLFNDADQVQQLKIVRIRVALMRLQLVEKGIK